MTVEHIVEYITNVLNKDKGVTFAKVSANNIAIGMIDGSVWNIRLTKVSD